MIDDIGKASRLGYYISKDYARGFLSLLARYRDLSASEAASRLGIHISTAQDFLEAMESLGILSKQEVYEKKRPYYRYSLEKRVIEMRLDLGSEQFVGPEKDPGGMIREKKQSRARFTTSRSGDSISSITIWTGEGRGRKEHRISLTAYQGKFLYHLPFPNAEAESVEGIMKMAGLEEEVRPEIDDMVALLAEYKVIERIG